MLNLITGINFLDKILYEYPFISVVEFENLGFQMFPYVRGCDISENIRLEDVKGGN